MHLPAPVADVCATFLELAPAGFVTGLYVTGGTGLGEWVPGRSDVDFVATTTHRPDAAETETLRAVHAEVRRRHRDTHFDGLHVLAADVARDPDLLPDGPCVVESHFEVRPRADLVGWHELAWHGLRVHGPAIAELGVWTDRDRLVAHTRTNLDTYWRGWAERLAAAAEAGVTGAPVEEWACSWCVLGSARLHHLLVTGEMTTKSRAGRWGLGHYPERFHRVLREALRIREGGGDEYRGEPALRGVETAAFTAYVVSAGTATPA